MPQPPGRRRAPHPLTSSIGDAIRRTREATGTSRRRLAEAAGLSYSYVSEIENGAKAPSSRALLLLADALGSRASELLTLSESTMNGGYDRMPDKRTRARGAPVEIGLGAELARSVQPATDPASAPSAGLVPAPHVPELLVRSLENGTCVAFVGAGFSAAAGLPGWGTLLTQLAEDSDIDPELRTHIAGRVDHGTAHAFDEAAQLLDDQIGRERLLGLLRKRLMTPPRLPPGMTKRIDYLRGIPFRAILTTNFDGVLKGAAPDSTSYRAALRQEAIPWWSENYWPGGGGAFTLKLHGDLLARAQGNGDIVLTRRDYRRRLYEDSAYQTFLRSVMATCTVLYLGFSFEDAYLNELRSEVLALVGQRPDSAPVSYAITSDVPSATRLHFRAHEGIDILAYDTLSPTGSKDHTGFERYLAEIHRLTNPREKFARRLRENRVLWVDPHPQNNDLAFNHFRGAADLSTRPTSLELASSAEAALARLGEPSGEPFDLVISHWGSDQAVDLRGKRVPTAVALLSGMRERDLRVPVVIFAAEQDADRRKRTAFGLGAQAYCFRFNALYREIERIMAPASETG